VEEAQQHAMDLLRENRPALDRVAEELIDKEVVNGDRISSILHHTVTSPGEGEQEALEAGLSGR